MRWVAFLVTAAVAGPAAAQVPGRDWPTGSPESQGLSSAGLDAATAFAQKSGGASGCVVRHGVLVKEWGDPKHLADIKSAAKGSVGTTLLGLAVDAGLVKLDEPATAYDPDLGTEVKGNAGTGWLKTITVRNLATMTAGFDDGRPPKLVYKPGTKGIYSNGTSNMLAEVIGRRYGADLKGILKRKVMDPIGVPEAGWTWRANQFRPKERGGLTTREFASGIRITARSLARIGLLYLHDGEWGGKRILSREFVREATRPTDLPAPFPYYGFYWGTNGRGTFKGMPRDTFWALGLGDSFVVVCPSLDIVAVRLGVGSTKSQLPDDGTNNWGGRVESFFQLVVQSARDPYPPSQIIRGISWAPRGEIVRLAKGSDNWPATWADDDALYTAYGDGNGFKPFTPAKLSLGLAKVTGTPPDVVGVNVRAPTLERKGDGKAGPKASGMLMVDGVLYLLARNEGNSRLAWSKDRGRTWEWADWTFTTSFGCPTFLNCGKNHAGARDGFVYVYSHDHDSAYEPADRMVLARVPKGKIREKSAYEFFAGTVDGKPTWTADVGKRAAVFEHKGKCYRSGIAYHKPTGQYLWCQVHPGPEPGPRFKGGFGVYAAPEPWGPWTTVYYTEEWDAGPGETNHFPPKWMAADGRSAWLVFSGDDCFSVRRAVFRPEK